MRYAEDKTLKLHTAPDGNIWFAAGNCEPRCSNTTLSNFTTHDMWDGGVVSVQVLGTRANAGLLVYLYEHRKELQIGRFEVAGPQVCETRQELIDPEITLFRMRQCLLPASLGGWHTFSEIDYVSYQLASLLLPGGGLPPSTEDVMQLLQRHPVWRSLSFAAGLDVGSCAALIGGLCDPRWFVAPHKPNSASRFRRYLGLEPAVVARVNNNESDPQVARYRLVLSAWKTRQPDNVAIERPENFLWRVWRESGERGDLRASQYFAFYLFHVWRNALSTTSDGLLDLDAIFKSQAEIASFKQYLTAGT